MPLSCWVPDSVAVPGAAEGPLRGCSVAVKDLFAVEGRVSSFGNARWRETHDAATETAPAVARLLAAGASVRGLAKLDQLAYSLTGSMGEGTPPVNPVYPGRFAGGSSSGPASAVAGGEVSLGLGTDTAGSVRVPAAACGVFGWRPTHGVVDSRGVLPLAPSFDVVGVLAREAGLLRTAAGVLAPAAGLGDGVPVGVVRVPEKALETVEPFVARAVEGVGRRIAAGGLDGLDGLVDVQAAQLFTRLQAREVWATHGEWVSAHRKFLGDDVRERLAKAEAWSLHGWTDDAEPWAAYRAAFDEALPPGTVAVMPVLGGLPPSRTASADELVAFRVRTLPFNAPASLAGAPVVVVPVRDSATGLVTGVALMAGPGGDATLLDTAVALCPDGEIVEV